MIVMILYIHCTFSEVAQCPYDIHDLECAFYQRAPLNHSPTRQWRVCSRIWRVKIAYLLASVASDIFHFFLHEIQPINVDRTYSCCISMESKSDFLLSVFSCFLFCCCYNLWYQNLNLNLFLIISDNKLIK